MKRTGSFIEGPILSPLLRFTFPVLLALFLQAMYGAVDLMVVGRFGQPADVSAVSTGSQVMHTVTCLVTGLSMGATVLLGQKLGEGRQEEGGQVLGSAAALFAAVALALTGVMVWAASPMARLMQAPPEAFDQTVAYVRICSGGAVFIVAYNVLGAMFRGIGDSKTPLLTVFIACAVNIAGDLVFVGGLGLGVAGAALATVLAQGVSVALSLVFTARRGLPFPFSRRDIRRHGPGHRGGVSGAHPCVPVHEPPGAGVPVLGGAGHALLHRGADCAVSVLLCLHRRPGPEAGGRGAGALGANGKRPLNMPQGRSFAPALFRCPHAVGRLIRSPFQNPTRDACTAGR